MQRPLNKHFKDFIGVRVDEVSYRAFKSPKCCKLSIRIRERYADIATKLGKEHSELLSDYEDAQLHMEAIMQKIIYRQGLLDGTRITNACRKVTKLNINRIV